MITYEKFLKLGISLVPLGVEARTDNEHYFCTPRGAKVLGWAGVDGIHYCFVRGRGDMVFAVSPMNAPGEYVYPIAGSFEDFLRLLMACSDAAALEQAWQWNEGQFNDFLRENPPTDEQKGTVQAIADATGLAPVDEPWQYIHELQAGFDYSLIKYTDDSEIIAPVKTHEWRVRYSGGILDGSREHPGTEIAIAKTFEWCGDEYYIPAAYSCAKGLVIDIFKRVPKERIQAFIDKYHLSTDSDEADFDRDTMRQIDRDNPLNVDFSPTLILNGREVRRDHGLGECWNPITSECVTDEIAAVMEHYALDRDCGWAMFRWAFPWKKRCEVQSLSIIMSADKTDIDGPIIDDAKPGRNICLTHPITGAEHTLTVHDVDEETTDFSRYMPSGFVLPTCYTTLTYSLKPDIAQDEIYMRDCDGGDIARRIETPSADDTNECSSASVGIIGGADGPVAIFTSALPSDTRHVACSSMRFEHCDHIRWRVGFRIKLHEDINVKLI